MSDMKKTLPKSKTNITKNIQSFFHANVMHLETLAPVGLFVLLFVFNCIFTKNFASVITLRNLIIQSASLCLVALGITLVIAAGNIDISLGSGFAWNAVIFAMIMKATDNIFLAAIAVTVSAVAIGTINGILVSKFKIQAMIATMAMMYILRSLGKVITESHIISFRNATLGKIVYFKAFGVIPIHFFVILIPTILILILVRKTRYGVSIEACGDNYAAARTAGVPVLGYILSTYIICNLLTAMGGVLETVIVSSANPMQMGLMYEMRAIAAVVIGGTSIAGGKPNIIGTVFGVLIMRIISMMINMNNISEEWSFVVTALVIIVTIGLQNIRKIRRAN